MVSSRTDCINIISDPHAMQRIARTHPQIPTNAQPDFWPPALKMSNRCGRIAARQNGVVTDMRH
jgi:hypothetical protein